MLEKLFFKKVSGKVVITGYGGGGLTNCVAKDNNVVTMTASHFKGWEWWTLAPPYVYK